MAKFEKTVISETEFLLTKLNKISLNYIKNLGRRDGSVSKMLPQKRGDLNADPHCSQRNQEPVILGLEGWRREDPWSVA